MSEASPERRRRWARLALLPLAAGMFLLFPGLKRSEIEFRYRIDDPKCVDRVVLELFEGDTLARANRQLVEGRRSFSHLAKLKHGEFRAVVGVECRDGSTPPASRQPIVVDRDGVIEFKVAGSDCRCSSG